MSTASLTNDLDVSLLAKPGATLALKRHELGYSIDYVANKLHLRVRMIELLEADQYDLMPQPVFIKGYLRGYAKLVDLAPEPLLATYNQSHACERKLDKALWQSRRAPARAEHAIRWGTGLFSVVVLVAVIFWWQNNKDTEKLFAQHIAQAKQAPDVAHHEIRLTDLSKMRTLLSSESTTLTEKQSV